MKQTIVMVSILITFLLVSCDQKDVEQVEEKNEPLMDEKGLSVQTLITSEEDFRFVAGWLDKENIVFVDHHDTVDRVRKFNLATGDIHTIFTDTDTISEVLIHSVEKQLLVKTASVPTEANVIIIEKDGEVLTELTVESSELEMKWNDVDATKLLISAFQEDWSYQVLLYDTIDQSVETVELVDPFPRWVGKDKIGYLEDSTLMKRSLSSGEESVVMKNVNSFYAFFDQLVVEVAEEDTQYSLLTEGGEIKHSWNAENTLETVEDVKILNDNNIIMSTTEYTENNYDYTTVLHIIGDKLEKQFKLEIEGGLLSCSPSGEVCLVGYSLDTLIDLQTGETTNWLQVDEVDKGAAN
ncbi:YqgU-like beta propeller domain-containing protein [Sporosarcina obsidiansis]|uniref:YqgU-like beta propeller domain-containing protein n=1 Tax=Sporosarcina obsidiansis TaxID=2660748 RepID=UPI00129C0E0B|nr:hypothetical protein [Sporosarcina obsidiansis]